MVTRSKLNNESTRDYARGEIRRLQWKQGTGIKFELALKKAKWVDDFLDEALNWLSEIHATFFEERTLMDVQNLTGEKIREILRNDKPKIIELVKIYNIIDPDQLQYKVWTDGFLDMIDTVTHGITRQLPGLHSRIPSEPTVLIPFSQFLDLFRDPHKSLLIPVQQVFKRVCCFVSSFRAILEEKHSRETTNFVLEALNDVGELIEKSRFTNLLQRYLWRLQDLYDGGGLGFTVELFFLALKPLLSSSSSQESQSTIYIGTFRTITSDWAKYKHSIGTQKILLDAITSRRGILREFRYPLYITEEFLDLLGNVLHEQKGTHIDAAVEELNNNIPWHDPIDSYYPDAFWKRVLDVVSRSRTAVPAPPFS
ncbi:hypothetical protein F5148DRAFT_1287769 [Russula earlei]|uniref:Uncharacterized protein n=1 Tax=Russula earlei TaxID=71964 RepID=A0ACC0U1U3_9AGAM|nr:hypothetical protein F5148DRAFT_1287769 [Russula earlei]